MQADPIEQYRLNPAGAQVLACCEIVEAPYHLPIEDGRIQRRAMVPGGPAIDVHVDAFGASLEGPAAQCIEAQHVPYKETFLPDLIAGRIQFAVAPTPGVIGHIKGGKLRALATLTDERLDVFEGVPSIRELGWPNQVFYGGLFLFAPASLAAHGARINDWLVAALREPDVAVRFREAAIEPTPQGLDDVRRSVEERLRLVDSMRLAVLGRTR